jgi:DNA-binding NarL/FixJ family response regulator
LKGQNYFSPQLVNSILKDMHSGRKNSAKGQNPILLSEREDEVLKEICKGYSNHEIAGTLFISPRTVERHRANLLSKTGCKNSIGLVMFAIKNGLVQVS